MSRTYQDLQDLYVVALTVCSIKKNRLDNASKAFYEAHSAFIDAFLEAETIKRALDAAEKPPAQKEPATEAS